MNTKEKAIQEYKHTCMNPTSRLTFKNILKDKMPTIKQGLFQNVVVLKRNFHFKIIRKKP